MADVPLAELKNSALREPVLLRYAAHLLHDASRHIDPLVVMRAAIDEGLVRSVRADVPGMGIQTFVDAESVESEVSAYWARVDAGEINRPVVEPGRRGSRRRYWIRRALGVPLVVRVVQRFCSRPEQFLRVAQKAPFWPVQRLPEISALVRLVAQRRPRFVLEIGTSRGGTTYLWAGAAHRKALIASVDITRLSDAKLLRAFARPGQRVEPIIGDSKGPDTIGRIRRLFPEGVDFLFIDGDHSYEGVRSDYETYEPMVRPGGLVACHDIVEDNRTRYGINTGGRAGGVPEFWKWIKPTVATQEFVEDPEQDGAGIGVIFKP
jgi:predicted O-methyltransferase YrrM